MKINDLKFITNDLATAASTYDMWNNDGITWTYNLGTSPAYKDLIQQITNFTVEKEKGKEFTKKEENSMFSFNNIF